MKCALCTRSEEQVKLFNLFKHKCCGSCKTAYYRGLTRLHEYVDLRNKIKNASDLQALVWKFLCDSDFCIQKRALNLTQLCPIDLETKKKQCAPGSRIVAKNRKLALTATGTGLFTGNTGFNHWILLK